MKTSFRAVLTFTFLSFLALGVQAESAQFEEATCALSTSDFQANSQMQIKVVSSVSNTTGYSSFSTLIHKEREIRIGKTERSKIFDLANGPLEHRISIHNRKGVLRFASQATISRGNGEVKVRQAILEMLGEPTKTLLCIYSTY